MKGARDIEEKRSTVHLFIPQMLTIVRDEPGQSREAGMPPVSTKLGGRGQVPAPSLAASQVP